MFIYVKHLWLLLQIYVLKNWISVKHKTSSSCIIPKTACDAAKKRIKLEVVLMFTAGSLDNTTTPTLNEFLCQAHWGFELPPLLLCCDPCEKSDCVLMFRDIKHLSALKHTLRTDKEESRSFGFDYHCSEAALHSFQTVAVVGGRFVECSEGTYAREL